MAERMKHAESKLQIECVRWFRLAYPKLTLFAIPNGGRRGKIEASIMKAEGVLAGVADLFLAAPSKEYHGIFLEMKHGSGKQTGSQKEFQNNAEAQGYQYTVCKTFDEFKTTIENYLV